MILEPHENDYGCMELVFRRPKSSQWYKADDVDAEIARLRALVRSAFHEGFKAAYCTALTDEEAVAEFELSDSKKELERQQ